MRWALGIAGLVAFIVFIELYLGWGPLLAPWAQLPGLLLPLVVGLVLVSYLLRTLRIYDYFRDNLKGGFLSACKLVLQHNLANNMLPMRTGEATFPLLMSRYFQVPLSRSLPALLWFRLLDLHVLGLVAMIALGKSWLGPVALASLTLIWLLLPWVFYLLNHWLLARLHPQPSGRLSRLLHKLLDGAPKGLLLLLRTWLWGFLSWLVKLSAFAWLLMLFTEIPLATAFLGAIGGELSSVLPVHAVAGVGTYETGIVAALLPFGVKADVAVAGAVNVHLFLLGVSLLGGGLSLLIRQRPAP
jgi:uncharacterized membrane protein YbhN (UPF0104 family)